MILYWFASNVNDFLSFFVVVRVFVLFSFLYCIVFINCKITANYFWLDLKVPWINVQIVSIFVIEFMCIVSLFHKFDFIIKSINLFIIVNIVHSPMKFLHGVDDYMSKIKSQIHHITGTHSAHCLIPLTIVLLDGIFNLFLLVKFCQICHIFTLFPPLSFLSFTPNLFFFHFGVLWSATCHRSFFPPPPYAYVYCKTVQWHRSF